MLDKIKASKAKVKEIISGKPYVAPVAPVVIPEVTAQSEVKVENTEEYPLNHE